MTAVAPNLTPTKKDRQSKPLPPPNNDFYQLADVLTDDEKTTVKKVRTYMESKVQPIINKYWSDDGFSAGEIDGLRASGAVPKVKERAA
jgi:hypothetical protein